MLLSSLFLFYLSAGNPAKQKPHTQNKYMQIIDNIIGALKKITELGVALLALAVVLQVIFGSDVAFLKVDVVSNLTSIIQGLGDGGLVGLIAAAILYSILKR